jgi:hypothetical protein
VIDPGAQTVRFEFSGALLKDGVWLYVWRVHGGEREVLYVGGTGDSSSANAASPFQRVGQHLGYAATSNMLRTHLIKEGIRPEECDFQFVGYGPLFPREAVFDAHRVPRDKMAALEKALADALRDAGYEVLNTVRNRMPLDRELWDAVRAVFAEAFPKLSMSFDGGERPAEHADPVGEALEPTRASV